MKKRIGFALVCIGCIVAGMGFGLDFYLEEMAERHPIFLYPSDCDFTNHKWAGSLTAKRGRIFLYSSDCDFTNHKWAGLTVVGIGALLMLIAEARWPGKRLL